jgi:Domain of unknown function (DUF4340)
MKKSTLIVLAIAIIAGAAFYYFDWKRGDKDTDAAKTADKSKPAFTFQPGDVTAITVTHPGDPAQPPVVFARRNSDWQITQPIATLADNATVSGIAQGLANARIEQTQPGTPDRLKVYGLDPAAVVIDFKMQNGANHTVQLGKKDFDGSSVYAKIDSNKDVSQLPESLLGLASKSLDDFRDRSVLHAHNDQIVSFDLKNSSGQIAATKDGQNWKFSKPSSGLADSTTIDELLAAVTGGHMVSVASETPDDLAKYGLASPAITFTATDAKGKAATVIVGKKDGDNFFAREESLPVIFRINADLEKKLSESFADLRDKKIIHFDPAAITHIDLQNSTGAISITRKSEDEWTFDSPPAQKGKSASAEKLFSPLEQARADQVIDNPPASVTAKFAKPAFEATLTSKDGKKLTVTISKDADGFVYARSSEAPTVYKLKKQLLDDLSFKASDMAF